LTVLTYHHVHERNGGYPFDPDVIDVLPGEFDRQLATLQRYFSLIGIAELRAFVAGRAQLPANAAMITFDDGYRSCHDVALPILQRHRARAVFFVATDYISQRRVYWWDRISYVVQRSARERLAIQYPEPLVLDLSMGRSTAGRRLVDVVRRHYDLDLERFLAELTAAAGVPWDEELERRLADEYVCTWDHVRALCDAGMDVGSHTCRHRVLQTLSPAALQEELTDSRAVLENELGRSVCALSYPMGKAIRDAPRLRAAVSKAGYELGFSNDTGVNSLRRKPDPLDLRRTCCEVNLPLSYFRGTLAIPPLSYSQC